MVKISGTLRGGEELTRFTLERIIGNVRSSVSVLDEEGHGPPIGIPQPTGGMRRKEFLVGNIHDILLDPEHISYTNLGNGRGIWVVQNNTLLSPDRLHLGGCRIKPYDSSESALADAKKLARGMTHKWAILNYMLCLMALSRKPVEVTLEEVLASMMGGGKSVIYDPNFNGRNLSGPAHEIPLIKYEEEIFEKVARVIRNHEPRYIFAPDMGTNCKIMDYFAKFSPDNVVCLSLANHGSGDPSVITARGVYESMLAAIKHKLGRDNLEGLRIAIQGVGNVGSNLINNIVEHNKNVYLIICDANAQKGLKFLGELSEQGIDGSLQSKNGNRAEIVYPDQIYDQQFDIFSPNAKGQVLDQDSVARMVKANEGKPLIIVGGANNQIDDRSEHSRKEVESLFNEHGILYAPDFVVNLGGILNTIYEIPLVKKAVFNYDPSKPNEYDSRRPLAVVQGVRIILEHIFNRAKAGDESSTQRIAERMAEEHLARFAVYYKITSEALRARR